MSDFEIDYDAEAVWLDDAWYGREQLAARIKSMIEAGDYRLARPSAALERLEAAIADARVMAVRVPAELSLAYGRAAEASGRPVQALVREALSWWLASRGENVAAEAPVEEHVPLDDPEMEKSWLGR